MLPAGVPLSHEERLHPCHPETAGVRGAGVALKEREEDLGFHVREQPERPGPEPLQLCAELIHHPGSVLDQILTRAGQCPDRLRLIRIGLQDPEAMMIGASELAEHERVEPI